MCTLSAPLPYLFKYFNFRFLETKGNNMLSNHIRVLSEKSNYYYCISDFFSALLPEVFLQFGICISVLL